jgi:hypothetical protein
MLIKKSYRPKVGMKQKITKLRKEGTLVHWFFTKDSTIIKTYFITKQVTIVSKSQWTTQMCWPKTSKAKW